jgi:hypothetical protein
LRESSFSDSVIQKQRKFQICLARFSIADYENDKNGGCLEPHS